MARRARSGDAELPAAGARHLDKLTFRPLEHGDLPLLHEWLQRPHVRRWWTDHETLEEVTAHYAPAIDGADPTDLFFALHDGVPVAFVQTYLLASYPEYAAIVGAEPGAGGVDIFVADEGLTGQGLGTQILRRFVDEIVFAAPGTTHCLADPEPHNTASMRAFAKAGFRVVGECDDPSDGKRHAIVRRDRS